jgi:hypothetical protein
MSKLAVISRYNESIDWVNSLKFDYLIYNKGEQISNLDREKVINVPNDGREAETYLRYITENYYNLPDQIYFLQGNPFDHCHNLIDILEINHNKPTCFGTITKTDMMGNPSYPGLNIGDFRNMIIPESYGQSICFVAGAQLSVSKAMVTSKSFEWWSDLRSVYNKYWFSDISSIYHWIPPGHFIAHVFERLWPSIFCYKFIKKLNTESVINENFYISSEIVNEGLYE